MTKYLVVDCETTGIPRGDLPADADGQPRMAHLAMIFLDDSLAVEREESFIVKPDGWVMPAAAEAVNGLSTNYLSAHGRPIALALDAYAAAIDSGYAVVAHKADFDLKILRGELRRAGRDDMFDRTPNICTMRALTDVCQIPYATKRAGYKQPKLAEALAHFGFPVAGLHTAMDDARGAMLLLRKMVELGVCPEPEVHRAREGTKSGEALKARGGTPEASTRPAKAPKPDRRPMSEADIANSDIPE